MSATARFPSSLPTLKIRTSARASGQPSGVDRELFQNVPTGRREVLLLDQWLNKELDANQFTEDPLNAVKQAQQLYSICFHELLRQVRATCTERGTLMEKIWSDYLQLFEDILKMRELEREGYNARIREHQDHYQQLYKEKDVQFSKMYLQLAAEKEKALMGKDKLDRAVALLHAEHKRWLERDERMRKYLRRLRHQLDKHAEHEEEERPVFLLDLIEQPGFKESNMAMIQKLEVIFSRLAELSGLLTDSAVPLEALVLEIDTQVSAIKECCRLLSHGPAEPNADGEVNTDNMEEQKTFAEHGTQTRPLSAQGSESGAKPVPDVFRPYFLLHYYGDTEPVSEEWLLRLISHLLLRKLRADEEADSRMEPHDPMPQFIYEEFLSLYGLRKLAERRLLDVIGSLDKYIDRPRVRVFAHFCALSEPEKTPHTSDVDVYLYALSLCHQALESDPNQDDFSLNDVQIGDVFKAMYGEAGLALLDVTPLNHKGRYDVDAVLEAVINESQSRTRQIESKLIAQLEAELANDALLAFGDFLTLVRRLNALHNRSDRELLQVYREAQQRSSSYKIEIKQLVWALHAHGLVSWRSVPFRPVPVAAQIQVLFVDLFGRYANDHQLPSHVAQ
eukprot:TRINITY_DN2282_c0_g2_i2.p1 TRINITY_DN2282_c0_g2~~TRINITY_DN2282_c0_g2_i2.p1  ORF type:complete len:631 (-),score=255.40 TRINITY_DN2282_c0_g2_i2:92-1951(-)